VVLLDRPFEFGSHRLDEEGRLFRHGQRIHLPPKETAVLVLLVQRAGQTLTKGEIFDAVWPEAAPADESLARCIYALRVAMGDEGKPRRYIETVHGRGYRLVASVRPAAAVEKPTLRVVVLPFQAVGAASAPGMADAVSDAVMDALAERLPDGVAVISRQSSRRYEGRRDAVAAAIHDLGVDFVVAGRVAISTDRIRIQAELIRGSDLVRLGAGSHAGPRDSLEALAGDVATAIAAGLPLPRVPDFSPLRARAAAAPSRVYETWLLARAYWHRRTPADVEHAVELLGQVLAWKPDFAPAHASLADCAVTTMMMGSGFPSDCAPQARAAAERAIALDPALGGAHAALGYLAGLVEWSPHEAEASFARAVQLDPTASGTHFYRVWHELGQGRCDSALAIAITGLDLDPYSYNLNLAFAFSLLAARHFDEAKEQLRHLVRMAPGHPARFGLMAYFGALLGCPDEAIEAARRHAELNPGAPACEAGLAYSLASVGQREEARSLLARAWESAAVRYRVPSVFAPAAAALGDVDGAFRWLDLAVRQRCCWLPTTMVDPRIDPVRDDPRFAAIVECIRSGVSAESMA
jgi:DNA-binding winged helix-turn-helix (wHTH) protein/tetratricopeptide (TPR) repeat protein